MSPAGLMLPGLSPAESNGAHSGSSPGWWGALGTATRGRPHGWCQVPYLRRPTLGTKWKASMGQLSPREAVEGAAAEKGVSSLSLELVRRESG